MRHTTKAAALVAVGTLLLGGCKKKAEQPAGGEKPASGATQPQPATGAAANPSAANANAAQNPAGCNSDFKEQIKASYTLTEKCSPYTLDHELSVDGWDLTIEPGVTVKFAESGRLSVGWNNDARLTANGTAEKPIAFVSGGRQEPGAWRGIDLYTHSGGSSLQNVRIENAGRDDNPALELDGQDLHVKGVTVVASKNLAFKLGSEARVVEFEANDFSKAGTHEVIGSFAFASLGGIKAATNKWPEHAVIEVTDDAAKTDLAIANAGIPYRILHNVDVDAEEGKTAVVTVAPGVVFQMGEDTRWGFGWNHSGGAKFLGTAAEPIVFTRFGDSPEKGSWKGLAFYDHAKKLDLEYVKVEFAGTKDDAAISYGKPNSLGKLVHVTVSKAAGSAVNAKQDATTFEAFSDNTFEDVGAPALRFQIEAASNLGANNTLPAGGVIALEGDVKQDTTLTAQTAPYQSLGKIDVEGSSEVAPVSLTIQPGATLRFGSDASIGVGWNNPGALIAVGTAEKPITFTAAAGSWKGITIYKGKAQVENAAFEKLADDAAPVTFRKDTEGDVKALKLTGLKLPVRDCTEKKLQTNGVKTTTEGC